MICFLHESKLLFFSYKFVTVSIRKEGCSILILICISFTLLLTLFTYIIIYMFTLLFNYWCYYISSFKRETLLLFIKIMFCFWNRELWIRFLLCLESNKQRLRHLAYFLLNHLLVCYIWRRG